MWTTYETQRIYLDFFRDNSLNDLEITEQDPKKLQQILRDIVENEIGEIDISKEAGRLAYNYAMMTLSRVKWVELADYMIQEATQ
jgi:hypothetical protein